MKAICATCEKQWHTDTISQAELIKTTHYVNTHNHYVTTENSEVNNNNN